MARTLATEAGSRTLPVALLSALLALSALAAAPASAADISTLQQKVSAGRAEAGSLAGQLQVAQGELASAEQEAAAASAREQKLTTLLATGEEKAARLAAEVQRTKRRLAAEKRRLRRARAALATRLVAIYESGSPSTASIILASDSIDELATRTEYLERIQQSDSDLASRVAQVRRTVAAALQRVAALKARVDAYNERLGNARSEVTAVRENAEVAAAHLHSVAAARSAALATLKDKIGQWTSDIQAARAAEAERISAAEAEGEVERWLGGPYAIPAYIVMCESGGNYGAVNPSSGAGGAYQILPSTWELYGGQGEPQNAPKAEQDRIAAEIWADSGSSAWVCG
ncbi:MAG TPA: transglycosylase family protein [Solirubrobacterales bacterium]|nr:transglycosylase family protein [Solirubrobacterales bacterium]